jgi:hypothetical protein
MALLSAQSTFHECSTHGRVKMKLKKIGPNRLGSFRTKTRSDTRGSRGVQITNAYTSACAKLTVRALDSLSSH